MAIRRTITTRRLIQMRDREKAIMEKNWGSGGLSKFMRDRSQEYYEAFAELIARRQQEDSEGEKTIG